MKRIVVLLYGAANYLFGVAALVIFMLCHFWQSLPVVVWQVKNSFARDVVLGVGLAGWGLVLLSSFLINHFDLFGLRQVWFYFMGRDYTHLPFTTFSLYRYIRHPIQSGLFVGIWITPTMTVGHLIFALGMSAYILIGVLHEEQDLIKEFGDEYRQYMRVTGRFAPLLHFTESQQDSANYADARDRNK